MKENNKVNNDQPETGNLLASISKKELVSAPEGYFDGFAGKMMDQIQSAPVLYSLEKKELVTESAAYASQLHDRIMATIGQQHREAKVIPFSRKAARWSAVAATIAVLLTVGYYWSRGWSGQNISDVYTAENATAAPEEYQHYLENELNIDDAIAYYVNEHVTEAEPSEFVAEMDYLMAEEELELENL